jgi:hypothetical protein
LIQNRFVSIGYVPTTLAGSGLGSRTGDTQRRINGSFSRWPRAINIVIPPKKRHIEFAFSNKKDELIPSQ